MDVMLDNNAIIIEKETGDEIIEPGIFNIRGRQTASDAFYNTLYKLGDTALNGSKANEYDVPMYSLNELACRTIFRGSWLARKLITIVPKEMLRGGIEIKGIPVDEVEAMQSMWLEFAINQRLIELVSNARLFGGAIGIIMVKGQRLDTPLNTDRVTPESFMGLKVFDRWRLSNTLEFDPLTGMPTSYFLITSTIQSDKSLEITKELEGQYDGGFIKVHASRVIRYDGDYLPHYDFVNNNHWHASLLDRIMEPINNYMVSSSSLTSMSRNATTRVYKLSGLAQKLAQAANVGARNNLVELLQRITVSAGVEGITVIDAESDISILATQIDGAVKANERLSLDVCANAEVPYTKVFGTSPAGMNATGESDTRNFYDMLSTERKNMYPSMMKLTKVMYRSLFGKAPPQEMRFEFAALWQMDEAQKATIALTTTQAIGNLVDRDIISQRIALQEAKALSETTGIFDNITEEDINNASEELPPSPADAEQPLPLSKEETLDTELNNGEAE